MLAASVLLGASPLAAAPPVYCTGQRVTDDAGGPYYANGQRVVDGFGKEYYPNGSPVKTATGTVRYPNGQQVRTATGTCYHETGVEMSPCQRVVPIRERLAGGETVFYQLDTVAGAIDLRAVRYEFPVGAAVVLVTADLASGRLDRASIGAVCPSR